MESMEHQEARARRAVDVSAALKAGAGLGAFLFIFAGGTPWTSGGTMNAVLGRPMPWPWLVIAVVHFALCIAYMFVLAIVVCRYKLIAAIGAGILTALVLFVVNWGVFAMTMGFGNDIANGRALVAHIVFGLFGAVIYKAVAVPRPMEDDRDKASRPLRTAIADRSARP
jgi:hypothetical protein